MVHSHEGSRMPYPLGKFERERLEKVNAEVNALPYQFDSVLWDREDFWERISKAKRGDCEDYALEKWIRLREELPTFGQGPVDLWLMPATCWVESNAGPGTGDYHAVLIVNTTESDLLLDNRREAIIPVRYAPYVWHKLFNPRTRGWDYVT